METDTSTLPQERRQRILDQLNQNGKVIAAELSLQFGVSEDTIRRDLRDMADAGLLQRVHGGALPLSSAVASYAVRETIALPAKSSIGKAAASLIHAGQVVIFDSGTTTLEVAKNLPTDLQATTITISPQIAIALTAYPNLEVILVGGLLNPHAMAVAGSAAIETIQSIRADICILGVCSLHPEVGVTATNFEETHLKRAMIASAADVIAVATVDKLGAAAPYVVASIHEVTHIVTEADVSDEAIAPYEALDITVTRA
ncbi:MAG TPA: DeoR/GlpR family DNA-binding transcription regulator [Crinalium sp.]|jgi:DeoR/GlpR family transcriptional regulator of sugar metabolism